MVLFVIPVSGVTVFKAMAIDIVQTSVFQGSL
jgi:hypothetical protein